MAIMTALVGASNLTTESINLLGLALGSAALVKLLTTHWLWGQCQGGYRRWVLPAITSAAILLGHWIVISSGLDWTLELLASNFAAMVLATLILVLCAVDVWILHSCDIHVMIHRSQQSSASYAFLYTGNFLDAAASLKATPTVLRRLPVLTYSFGFSLLARLLRTPARSAIGILWLTVLIVLFTVLSQLTADPVTGTFLLLGFYSASGIFFDVSRSEIESGGSISPFAESTSRRLFRSFLPAAIFLLIFSIAIPFLSSLSPLPMVFPLLLALSARLYQLSKARQDGTDTMVGLGGEMGAFLLVWKAIDSYAYFCALALIYLQGGPTLVLIALLFCGLLAWRGIVKIQRIG
ncbi:hypothetical protein [Acaricomes phytoseiuli]|uniref:hypothetical protein n=1 Tax=Acaricomes phytoseiuli TaxID=291968 RepID=UPI00037BF54F|nr:hypothetical protein [Acaricomes phytoseiuli]